MIYHSVVIVRNCFYVQCAQYYYCFYPKEKFFIYLFIRVKASTIKVISLCYYGGGYCRFVYTRVFVLAEFLIWAPVGICHARSGGMVVSLARQMSTRREVSSVSKVRTGDGAHCNQRLSPLSHSVPQLFIINL